MAQEMDPEMPENLDLRKRLTKTLQYGTWPMTERPSLALTKLLVNFFLNCVSKNQRGASMVASLSACANLGVEACITPQAAVIAVIYCRRHVKNNSQILNIVSPLELFLLSALVASKYLYDVQSGDRVYNDEWAIAAKKELEALNYLEVVFLENMDWKAYVSEKEFQDTLVDVERAIAVSQGEARGWFTTEEMRVLLSSDQMLWMLLRFFIESIPVLFGCVAFYTLVFCPTVYLLGDGLAQVTIAVGLTATNMVETAIPPIPAAEPIASPDGRLFHQLRHFESPVKSVSKWCPLDGSAAFTRRNHAIYNSTTMGVETIILPAPFHGGFVTSHDLHLDRLPQKAVCRARRGLRRKRVNLSDAMGYNVLSCDFGGVFVPGT